MEVSGFRLLFNEEFVILRTTKCIVIWIFLNFGTKATISLEIIQVVVAYDRRHLGRSFLLSVG